LYVLPVDYALRYPMCKTRQIFSCATLKFNAGMVVALLLQQNVYLMIGLPQFEVIQAQSLLISIFRFRHRRGIGLLNESALQLL